MLNRNERGQFVKNECACAGDKAPVDEIAKLEARLAELKAAKAAKEEEEKKAAALARKEEANVVNEAIDKYEAAKAVCNENIKAAYAEYRAKVTAAEKELKKVEADADNKLNEYLKTHESFHYTYRSKDGKRVKDYDYRTKAYDIFDNFKLFEDAMKLWF